MNVGAVILPVPFGAPKKCDLLHHKQIKKHEPKVAAAKRSTKAVK